MWRPLPRKNIKMGLSVHTLWILSLAQKDQSILEPPCQERIRFTRQQRQPGDPFGIFCPPDIIIGVHVDNANYLSSSTRPHDQGYRNYPAVNLPQNNPRSLKWLFFTAISTLQSGGQGIICFLKDNGAPLRHSPARFLRLAASLAVNTSAIRLQIAPAYTGVMATGVTTQLLLETRIHTRILTLTSWTLSSAGTLCSWKRAWRHMSRVTRNQQIRPLWPC